MGEQMEIKLSSALVTWWRESVARRGWLRTAQTLLAEMGSFLRDSTPGRRRLRYGDMDYDWDHRVDTTSATVTFRERLFGIFHSPYQPSDPSLFHEMMSTLKIDFGQFTFADLGSGKGRTLLMAAEYPFARIIGVELLPRLHEIAQENIGKFKSEVQKCFQLESICGDASEFSFPPGPLVLYLFNPFPVWVLEHVMTNLKQSLRDHPRPLYLLYHNPLLEPTIEQKTDLQKRGGTHQYSVYAFDPTIQAPAQQKSLE